MSDLIKRSYLELSDVGSFVIDDANFREFNPEEAQLFEEAFQRVVDENPDFDFEVERNIFTHKTRVSWRRNHEYRPDESSDNESVS